VVKGFILSLMLLSITLNAQVATIDVGTHYVEFGDTNASVPILVSGQAPITDMVGIVQLGDGGPLVGGGAGPVVTAVDFSRSIWTNASGGFTNFYPSVMPPEQIVDPNVSLLSSGQSVIADGELMTLELDVSGLAVGSYALSLAGTAGGTLEFYHLGENVTGTILNGSLVILEQVDFWRREEFGDDVDSIFKEETVWGDNADPDGDLLTNLKEFLLGLDPSAPDTVSASLSGPGVPCYQLIEENGNRFMRIQYAERVTTIGVSLAVSISADLATWDETEADITELAREPMAGGEFEYVTKQCTVPVTSGDKKFFRITCR